MSKHQGIGFALPLVATLVGLGPNDARATTLPQAVALTRCLPAQAELGTFEATVIGMTQPTGEFVRTKAAIGLGVAAHFAGILGVEAWVAGLASSYTPAVEDIYKWEQLTPEAVDLKQPRFTGGVSLRVVPISGLLTIYGWQAPYHLVLSAGPVLVGTKEACVPARGDCSEDVGIGRGLRTPDEGAWRFGGSLGAGLRVDLGALFVLRAEVRSLIYNDHAVEPGGPAGGSSSLNKPVFLMLGLGMAL